MTVMEARLTSLLIIAVLALVGGATAFEWKFGPNSVTWAWGCDFKGNDVAHARSRGEDCSELCRGRDGCTHFTWTNHDGGTCWMKSNTWASENQAISKTTDQAVCGFFRPKADLG